MSIPSGVPVEFQFTDYQNYFDYETSVLTAELLQNVIENLDFDEWDLYWVREDGGERIMTASNPLENTHINKFVVHQKILSSPSARNELVIIPYTSEFAEKSMSWEEIRG